MLKLLKRKFLFLLFLAASFVLASGMSTQAIGQVSTYSEFQYDEYGMDSDSVVRLIVAGDQSVVQQGADLPVALVLDIAPGWHIWTPKKVEDTIEGIGVFPNADYTNIESIIASSDSVEFNLDFIDWPEYHTYTANLGGGPEEYASFEGRAIAWIPATVKLDAPLGKNTITVEVVIQSCNDVNCKPASKLTATFEFDVVESGMDQVPTDLGGIVVPEDLYNDLRLGVAAPDIVKFDIFGWEWRIDAAGAGLYLLLAIAALGGFLLNLTPCVLPVIPLKIMGLSQSAEGSRGKTFLLGVALGVGVVSFWLGLGFLIATVSTFTASNQLFQYPWFTITVGVFIAIMAIGMCGLFSIELPSSVSQFNPGHDSLFGSFLFGIMTAILSTPCTAPFMGAAAGWAASKDASITMLVFATIGFGMALPYIVLSAYPKLISKMPRSGPASELIKQVMGLMMLGAAVYFIGVGLSGLFVTPPNPPSKLYWWAVAAPLALAGLWMAYKTIKITPSFGRRFIFAGLGLLIAVGSVFGATRFTDKGPIKWTYYTHQRFDEALASGHVVLLEYTAEWCLNCKALEESVLRTEQVSGRIAEKDVSPIKIDLTKGYPEANERLVKSGRRTIPLIQIFAPNGKEVFKSDTYTAQQVLDAIEKAKNLN